MEHTPRQLLDTEALIVAYAMSRLDQRYLASRECKTWKSAFHRAARSLSIPPASLKHLRDEFDPFHSNSRRGWHKRELRPSRLRILEQMQFVSDDALLALVTSILDRRADDSKQAVEFLANETKVVHNVAERLLTGARAEAFFLSHCKEILGISPDQIVDCRSSAAGFDFGVKEHASLAIEVKGLKARRGDILFTDREWSEATSRRESYILVVIGNLVARPTHRTIRDPARSIAVRCQYQSSVVAVWRASVAVSASG